jgi:hypothetical protein
MRTYRCSSVAFVFRVVPVMCVLALTGITLPRAASADPAKLIPPQSFEVPAEVESSSVSVAEAKANLAVQHQAAQVDLVGQLEEELGQSYASVWFDNEAGEFVVPVATAGDGRAATEASKEDVEEQFSSAALESAFRTEVVRYSIEELEQAQSKAIDALAMYFEAGQVQTALNPKTDALVLLIPEELTQLVEEEIDSTLRAAGIAVPVETQERPSTAFEATPSACNEAARQCDLPLRGGQEIFQLLGPNLGEYSGDACTVGFRANGNEGQKYILTAGHCHEGPNGEEIWNWSSSGPGGNHLIGTTSQWHWPGRDWAKINATGTWADQAPWPTLVAYWGTSPELPITGEAVPYVGETLCHSGANTGTSCGVITESNRSVHYIGPVRPADVNSMYVVKGQGLCLGGGDSGGPFFAQGTALGIRSGGGPDGCGEPGEEVFFSSVVAANEELGTNIVGPGAPEAVTGGTTGLQAHGAVVTGQLNPHAQITNYRFEYGVGAYTNLTLLGQTGLGNVFEPVSATLTGLEPVTTYKYRLKASNGLGTATGAEGTFTTAPAPPLVYTEPAEPVQKNSATLGALIWPLGSPTTYQFEYGTTTAYGSTVPVSPESIGAGRLPVQVHQAIAGLKEATTYHFRIKASNAGGISYGSDIPFTTPDKPVVTAEAASYVNTLEPQLNATINPERADTNYQFEYGTTTSYGSKVPIPAGEVSGKAASGVAEFGVKGLARSTTYHYRLTAENEVGMVHGADRSFTTLPPCKGAEAKCLWSLQATTNPAASTRFEMKSVSCVSATSCVAVGKNLYNNKSFVDRWNGSSWTLLSGTVAGEMRHLSCLSNGCFVVGVAGGAAATWWAGEIMGVGTWGVYPFAPALPAGATETALNGVSCVSETACTAVGSYRGSEGVYHPLVERWNGTAWSLQSAPNPAEGSAQNAMLSVSCAAGGCVAVGEAAGKPVAETWISGTWALNAPKLPAGAKGGKLSSVSCANLTCVAVGNSYESAGQEKPLAESFFLNSWTLMSAPSPAGAKGFIELAGVSCSSESACTAAGRYASSVSSGIPTELKTLVEAWNGSAWTIQSSPNVAGQNYNVLADVSCSSASACTAVGQNSAGLAQQPESLAERWNGSSWSTQTVANPEQPIEAELKAVSCSSNTLCVGVGKDLFSEMGFVEIWNGTEWMVAAGFAGEMRKISCAGGSCVAAGVKAGVAETWLVFQIGGAWGVSPQALPSPAGATETVLNGVSCSSASACTAVGSYRGSEGVYHPLVERWNGSAWSLQSAPNPAAGTAQKAMLAVSCASASSCMAVGEAAGKPVAEMWNGSAWVSVATPTPTGAKGATLVGISCGSTKECIAVGSSNEGVGTEKALVERWSTISWSILPTPTPSGAKGYVNLTDVSCLSPYACFSAGYYSPELSGGAPASLKTLAESWNGLEWTTLTTPNLASLAYNSLAGISCTTSINCTAVGGAAPNPTKRPPVQVAMRFE